MQLSPAKLAALLSVALLFGVALGATPTNIYWGHLFRSLDSKVKLLELEVRQRQSEHRAREKELTDLIGRMEREFTKSMKER